MGNILKVMSSTRYGKERGHAKNLAQTYLSYSKSLLISALGATAIVFVALLAVSQLDVVATFLNAALATDLLVVATALLALLDVVLAASTAFLFLLSKLEH